MSQLLTGNVAQFAILGAVFVTVLALFFGVRYLLVSRTNVVKDRLKRTVAHSSGLEDFGVPGPTGPRQSGQVTVLDQVLGMFSRVSRPSDEEELGRLRQRLAQAGFRGETALTGYLTAKVVFCLIAGALVVWLNSIRGEPMPYRYVALWAILAMMVGLYLPNLWLYNRVKKRQRAINHALPDALDLVVTCVEAGLGLDSSLDRVSREMRLSAPLLSRELGQTSLEMRAGMPRGDAFRRLANRTGVDEIRALAAIIIQTDIFGTSVAKSLRIQAESMRVRRTQQAEERAATVAVKMTIPLIFCILPALFAVLMGPAVVKIFRILLPTLGGH
jgi:tight adherence protein C